MILGLISGSVLVVLNRSIEAVIDSRVRMQAFELARRNMEELLSSNSVTDTAEFGAHELNEDIEWETVIEPFNDSNLVISDCSQQIKHRLWLKQVVHQSFLHPQE